MNRYKEDWILFIAFFPLAGLIWIVRPASEAPDFQFFDSLFFIHYVNLIPLFLAAFMVLVFLLRGFKARFKSLGAIFGLAVGSVAVVIILCNASWFWKRYSLPSRRSPPALAAVADSLEYHIVQYDGDWDSGIFPESSENTELTEQELRTCDKLLRVFIAEYNIAATEKYNAWKKENPGKEIDKNYFVINLDGYSRQYMAVVSPEDERIVYVNCLCRSSWYPDLDTRLIYVYDGGKCYFQLKIDLSQRKIFSFSINGEA
jgi:hypothetical protein